MPIQLKERRLADLSQIEVRYLIGYQRRAKHLDTLVIRYVGNYRLGSGGNPDAMYMCAMAKAGVAAFHPYAVIHDLSQLTYEWGDLLEMVFGVAADYVGARAVVVVGPGCEEAVRTLLLGINSADPIEKAEGVFRDLESAWEYVERLSELS